MVREIEAEGEQGEMRGEKKERDEMDYICIDRVSSSRPNVQKSEVTTA